MASVKVDKRTGNRIVRAYGGINPDTGIKYEPSEVVDKDASDADLEAAKERVELLADIAKGNTRTMTIGTLVNYYLEWCELTEMSPTTLDAYKSYNRRHVQKRIGSVPFHKATASTFSNFYRELLRPKNQGGAGLSVSTVEKIHSFLSGCFTVLSGNGTIPTNPMQGVKAPRGKTKEAKALVPCDFAKLRDYLLDVLSKPFSDDEGFEEYMQAVCWWLDLHSGIRRGELSGAQRKHVKTRTDGMAIRIARVLVQSRRKGSKATISAKPPKSPSSKRFVSLDDDTADVLTTYMAIQETVLAEHGVQVTLLTPLFCHADGSVFKPSQLTDAFSALVKKLGLEKGTHLHTLRHTHATYLLEQGENIRVVQERLGHARVQTTLELYGHVLPGRDGEAARAFAASAKNIGQSDKKATAPLYMPICPKDGEVCARFKELTE